MNLTTWIDALAWRLRARLGDTRVDQAFVRLAHLWRPWLRRPAFIGLTGSAGKTTAKELLSAMLAAHRRGVTNPGTFNMLPHLGKTLLHVKPWHDYCVMELSEDEPGVMDRLLPLLRPSIAVITLVRDDHLAAFASHAQLVREMRRLVECLPPQGTAVLNADDPEVAAMAAHCRAQVLLYGTGPQAELRAEDVCAAWPERLSMTLHHRGRQVRVATRLCGAHWVPAVLGAVGAALASGLTLEQCATSLAQVAPFEGRMQPVTLPDGVTFLRDDFKAPAWGIEACADFLRQAQAPRKRVVLGELSETRDGKAITYKAVTRRLLEVADEVIVVGPWATDALGALAPGDDRRVQAFGSVKEASDHVNSVARPGDLILLKGSVKQNHLQRIVLARQAPWNCWVDDCRMIRFCANCSERERAPATAVISMPPAFASRGLLQRLRLAPDELCVVGLGNSGSAFGGTPHNVGFEAVDHIARDHGLHWQQAPEAWVARGQVAGQALCLMKLNTVMNLSGPALLQLAQAARIAPDQIVLVHDDIHLPLGSVKSRDHGGAGGHKGVASVLGAFQTDAIRRVKIGVGTEGAQAQCKDHVVSPWPEAVRPLVQHSLALVPQRLLAMQQRAQARWPRVKVQPAA